MEHTAKYTNANTAYFRDMLTHKINTITLIKALTVTALNVNGQAFAQTFSAGGQHSLAISTEGKVVSWGLNTSLQCKVPSDFKNATSVSAGEFHSVAISTQGKVFAWGENSSDQCSVPEGLNNVVEIAAGSKHTLALQDDGTVVAWGNGYQLQCDVPENLIAVSVAAGNYHSLAISEHGKVVAWGNNGSGQIAVPSQILDYNVIDIAAGANHSIALTENGAVMAWGLNNKGQCTVPPNLGEVIAVDAGGYYSVALCADGSIRTWGESTQGQNRIHSRKNIFNGISAGKNHCMAFQEDGTLHAWGSGLHEKCRVPKQLTVAKPRAPSMTLPITLSNTPPVLSINSESIQFKDADNNLAIDALEKASIEFSISNIGPGPGRRLKVIPSTSGTSSGITIEPNVTIANLPANESTLVKIPIEASRSTQDGQVQVTIEVIEPSGFSPPPFTMVIETREFLAPQLEIVDFSSTMSPWTPNTPIGLDVLIQNTGKGLAEGTTIQLDLPPSINCYSNNSYLEIPLIQSGESIRVTYDMIVPRNHNQSEVSLAVQLKEKHGIYGTSWTHQFPFEGENTITVLSIQSQSRNEGESIERAALVVRNEGPKDVSFNQVPKDIIVTTVAVLPIDGKDCNGEMISGQDIASFTEGSLLGLYNVVERRNLERVLDEQKLALSGLIYEKSAVEAGCNVGAQGIIFTEYGCLTGQETIQLKLVDCQTSELYWSATGVNATAKETLDKVREELEK